MDVLQQMPRAQVDEFRDSVCTMFTQSSQPLATSVDISYVFTCTSKTTSCRTCSSADVYSVSCSQVCRATQHVETFQIHNTRIPILSHAPAAKPGCRKLSQVPQSSQPSLQEDGRSYEDPAEQSMIPDSRSCLQRELGAGVCPRHNLEGKTFLRKRRAQEYQ